MEFMQLTILVVIIFIVFYFFQILGVGSHIPVSWGWVPVTLLVRVPDVIKLHCILFFFVKYVWQTLRLFMFLSWVENMFSEYKFWREALQFRGWESCAAAKNIECFSKEQPSWCCEAIFGGNLSFIYLLSIVFQPHVCIHVAVYFVSWLVG